MIHRTENAGFQLLLDNTTMSKRLINMNISLTPKFSRLMVDKGFNRHAPS